MCGFFGIHFLILTLYASLHRGFTSGLGSSSSGSECCESIPEHETACRAACLQLSRTTSQVDQISLLASGPVQCPEHSMEFYLCAKESFPALMKLGTQSWGPCCNLTKTRSCKEACLTASSQSDIENHCSRSTEDAKLYQCIDRQKDGEKCCGKATASDDGLMCKATCWNMYLTNTLMSSDGKRQLRHHCTGQNREVVSCLQKQTRTTRQSNHVGSVTCCEATKNATCKSVCIDALRGDKSRDEKLDIIIGACGVANPMEPLYQCLLKLVSRDTNHVKSHDVVGIDSAKLHCCEKATSKRCNSLCVKTHDKKWPSISKFESNCGYLSSPLPAMETQLHGCLRDVDEPCQLGCSGLDFCTNMNNRPMEHFRSCNSDADMAAKKDILLWQKGFISLPSLQIPVKDIRTCEPEMWKAIACAYQIKPCFQAPSRPQICQEDCVYILNKCVDTTRLKGQMVTDLCNRLPTTSSGNCISVKQYIAEGPHKLSLVSGGQPELVHPCRPNPCKQSDEICIIQRRKCHHANNCPQHVCKKACKMGQVSKVMVPVNTNVIVPVYKEYKGLDRSNCQNYSICHCSHNGNLGNCHDMSCTPKGHCTISNRVVKSHGEHFKSECNDCICFGGKAVCTNRQCSTSMVTLANRFTSIMNCDCPSKYDPVCATNGKTYPNSCVAQCSGQSIIHQGSCYNNDPCKDNPCETGYRCVDNRQVCLGQKSNLCIQYKCVDISDCNRHFHDPVCDTSGVEYTNDCMLLAKGKTLAYRGHCQVAPCDLEDVVCGHNGETYPNECSALADRTTVDYIGPCRTFFRELVLAGSSSVKLCEDVVCKPLSPSGCKGIIPPWSCCPVCAAELRILTSESVINTVSHALKQGPITLGKVLETLSKMVSVSQCDVFGYLSLDRDIVVLVAPVTQKPTSLQVNACMKEAERFEYLINSRSPTISSNMMTHSLLYASLQTFQMTLTSAATAVTHSYIVIFTILSLHYLHRILGVS